MRAAAATEEEQLLDLAHWTGLVAGMDHQLTRMSQSGLLASHQPCVGEEAVLVGASAAMQACDWVFWGRQVNAAALLRGLSIEQLFSTLLRGEGVEEIAKLKVVASTAGAATRLPHAVGLAHAARNDGVVTLCELGDGVVSDGDFHTGLTFAGVLHAPVVFVVRSEGRRPVLDRGIGYGVEAVQIQGDDVQIVHDAVSAAVERARQGDGPTLIEALINREQTTVPIAQRSAHEDRIAEALATAEQGSRSNA